MGSDYYMVDRLEALNNYWSVKNELANLKQAVRDYLEEDSEENLDMLKRLSKEF